MSPDGPDGGAQRPTLEPGMLRRARPDGYWWRAFRRRPWATTRMVALPIGFVIGAPMLVEAWFDVPLAGPAAVLGWIWFTSLRDRVRASADAADEAAGTAPGRPPVDVRSAADAPDAAATRPAFGPGTLTATQSRVNTALALVVLGGAGGVVVGLALTRRSLDPVLLGIGAALSCLAVIAVVLGRMSLRRRTAELLSRALEPVPVRVVGLHRDGLYWVVEAVDGRARSTLLLHTGNDLLVAGDVVHAWGDAVPVAGLSTGRRRLALTGPFGTIWVSRVVDPQPLSAVA